MTEAEKQERLALVTELAGLSRKERDAYIAEMHAEGNASDLSWEGLDW